MSPKRELMLPPIGKELAVIRETNAKGSRVTRKAES